MIPNLVSTVTGLVLVYATVLHPNWVERRYLPFGLFAAIILVMALWARRRDVHPWFSSVNIVLAIALGVLSLQPLATLPSLTFWGGFWVGTLAATVALWSALLRPKRVRAAAIVRPGANDPTGTDAGLPGGAPAGGSGSPAATRAQLNPASRSTRP